MKKNVGLASRAIVVLGVAMLALTSCTELPNLPATTELRGTWVHASDGATLSLQSGGKYVLTGIPTYALKLEMPTNASDRAALSPIQGRWVQGDGGGDQRDSNGLPLVTLEFDDPSSVVGRSGVTFDFAQSQGKDALYVYLGDPDLGQRYTFVKR